ncbi:hypothetical protein WJX73_008284 [Symbiochloris irregularis]|uniref:Glycosyltransferase 61 catalytic domain-containing protein n=1 Tax=Symbiochloris irregularis TaxID=706552 RepID=A0AAW1NTG5_9CHLO
MGLASLLCRALLICSPEYMSPLQKDEHITSFECIHDEGNADNRLCIFHNLAIFDDKLRYLYRGGQRPTFPDTVIEWGEGWHLYRQVEPINQYHIHPNILAPTVPVRIVDKAVLVVTRWPWNYGHSMGETFINFHINACLGFGHCNGSRAGGPALVRFEWANLLKNDPVTWPEVFPAVDEALKCVTDQEAFHIEDMWPKREVVILKKAVIGLGPHHRMLPAPDTRERFLQRFPDPPQWIMDSLRHRLANCTGVQLHTQKKEGKLSVTLINRNDIKRHIMNEESIVHRIREEFADDVDVVRVMRPHEMDFKHMYEMMASTSITILTHGAAQANLPFIAREAVVIEMLWHREVVDAHEWAADILRQSVLNATFIGRHNRDDRLGEWYRPMFLDQEGFAHATQDQRLAFYENGPITEGLLAFQERFHSSNFEIEWAVLKEALEKAIQAIRTGNHTWDVDGGRASFPMGMPRPEPTLPGGLFQRLFGLLPRAQHKVHR